MAILITGGTGYIGSHVALALGSRDQEIIILDNFSNSKRSVFTEIKKICKNKALLVEADIRDKNIIEAIFKKYNIDSVIHLAGLKAVGESCEFPLNYFDNNVNGTLNLIMTMKKYNVKKLVFSSSATVYGAPKILPIPEEHPLESTNPYGRTKIHIENMLSDIFKSDKNWSIINLRYFNPVGSTSLASLGDNPIGRPNNLMPYIVQVASGELDYINIYGDDYNTKDGTGVRDYIHVEDLADGHVLAANYLLDRKGVYEEINLGLGKGVSVLELIHVFENITGILLNKKITSRREGDIDESYADTKKAKKILRWQPTRSLEDMCLSAWNFYKEYLKNK